MAEALATDRVATARHGRKLEYFTIAWNCLEGLVAVIAGLVAGSISLLGSGIDSFIEVTSGAALLWRMSVDADVHRRERNELLALRIIGVCFVYLVRVSGGKEYTITRTYKNNLRFPTDIWLGVEI